MIPETCDPTLTVTMAETSPVALTISLTGPRVTLSVRKTGALFRPQADAVRAAARIPGGLALAGSTRGELQICRKLIGGAAETTAFVVWLRDLAR